MFFATLTHSLYISLAETESDTDDEDNELVYIPGRLEFVVSHPKFKAAALPSKGKEKAEEAVPEEPKFKPFQGEGRRLK
ncbi:hypothetical protein SARC_06062 [Sphaeroforma arctica JP610]|uniref:Uncharacterized protein n=1 Tax=Sphaeroforma arctica JP610 TaxID=667725 RepID=A0A0L0FYD2_9EUKA|nr:hypothetical protein SARC_06062 [Sphaeroforma arctica JP610]KNC81624.1 hypothetical protein SARC_06062 [Sphaeroforma arctica JP610]|eukprot:XP_014155526.1 hypothetical protein SARC_06062 [Sphaeroforma arctica JP610]